MTLTPSRLVRDFESQKLDPATFHHNDHVAAAYEMLQRFEFAEACSKYAGTIRGLAAKAGAPKKFNATITFAFMSLIAERMAVHEGSDYEGFIADNQDLTSKNVLDRYYSSERLNSETARQIFLMPDGI